MTQTDVRLTSTTTPRTPRRLPVSAWGLGALITTPVTVAALWPSATATAQPAMARLELAAIVYPLLALGLLVLAGPRALLPGVFGLAAAAGCLIFGPTYGWLLLTNPVSVAGTLLPNFRISPAPILGVAAALLLRKLPLREWARYWPETLPMLVRIGLLAVLPIYVWNVPQSHSAPGKNAPGLVADWPPLVLLPILAGLLLGVVGATVVDRTEAPGGLHRRALSAGRFAEGASLLILAVGISVRLWPMISGLLLWGAAMGWSLRQESISAATPITGTGVRPARLLTGLRNVGATLGIVLGCGLFVAAVSIFGSVRLMAAEVPAAEAFNAAQTAAITADAQPYNDGTPELDAALVNSFGDGTRAVVLIGAALLLMLGMQGEQVRRTSAR